MEFELTELQVEKIDNWMSDHMRGHAISNSIAGASCSIDCRRRGLKAAVENAMNNGEEQ